LAIYSLPIGTIQIITRITRPIAAQSLPLRDCIEQNDLGRLITWFGFFTLGCVRFWFDLFGHFGFLLLIVIVQDQSTLAMPDLSFVGATACPRLLSSPRSSDHKGRALCAK
jgi:hypothetical protein